jgi:hypothetical protein
VLARDHFTAEFAIHRWHPVAEEWEDPDVALPRTDAQRQAGHQRLMAEETAESRAIGAAQWQARAELSPHQEAVALAGKPRGEGQPVIRRWKFLVVPADGEDEAREPAGQISREPSRARQRAPGMPRSWFGSWGCDRSCCHCRMGSGRGGSRWSTCC